MNNIKKLLFMDLDLWLIDQCDNVYVIIYI